LVAADWRYFSATLWLWVCGLARSTIPIRLRLSYAQESGCILGSSRDISTLVALCLTVWLHVVAGVNLRLILAFHSTNPVAFRRKSHFSLTGRVINNEQWV
jgi:hypothetical protein